MACLIDVASKAEEEAYKAYVKWLSDAQTIRRMFLGADLSMPRALGRLFQEESKRGKRRKRITKQR